MYRLFGLFVGCLFLTLSCNTTRDLPKEDVKFQIEILQNGKAYSSNESPITLAREPFKLRITLNDIDGISFSSTFDRALYYDLSLEQDIFTCNLDTYEGPCKFVGPKCMAEPRFNAEKLLIIGDDNRVNCWFYDPNDDSFHRFDKQVTQQGTTAVAHRTVQRLYYPEDDRYIELADVTEDIYIVAAAQADRTDEDLENGSAGKELQRERIILRFE